MITDNDIKKLKTVFATKDDLSKSNIGLVGKIDNKIEKTEQKLSDEIKENYFKIFDLVDGLAGEVRDSRESRTIFSYRIEELEKRMEMVEKKLV